MKGPNLKQSSFVAYFSHLPPQEAMDKCATLQGAAEICSDVDNWKGYVAKRYGLKYSLQRPDLLTANEWTAQATALETLKTMPSDGHTYVAIAVKGEQAFLQSFREHIVYVAANPNALGFVIVRIPVIVDGLPIVASERTREVTFHVCQFVASSNHVTLTALSKKHPLTSSAVFEAPELCHRWMIELLVPYYSAYSSMQFRLSGLGSARAAPGRTLTAIMFVANDLNQVLTILTEYFKAENVSFELQLMFRKPAEPGQLGPAHIIDIRLKYVPAKLL